MYNITAAFMVKFLCLKETVHKNKPKSAQWDMYRWGALYTQTWCWFVSAASASSFLSVT